MALKIVWTTQAEKGLERVINYLENNWTSKEILNLERNIEEFIKRIAKYPKIYPATSKYKNLRKGLVDKNNYIIYRIKPRNKVIEIVNFRGTKQKPIEY